MGQGYPGRQYQAGMSLMPQTCNSINPVLRNRGQLNSANPQRLFRAPHWINTVYADGRTVMILLKPPSQARPPSQEKPTTLHGRYRAVTPSMSPLDSSGR